MEVMTFVLSPECTSTFDLDSEVTGTREVLTFELPPECTSTFDLDSEVTGTVSGSQVVSTASVLMAAGEVQVGTQPLLAMGL